MRGERRRDYGGTAVGALIGDRLRVLGYDAKIREFTAPLVWSELVGPQIAGATEVDRVKDGILFVHTRSAMWSHELTYHKADILRRLNERIGARAGEPIITDIRFQNRGIRRRGENEAAAPALHPTPEELDDVEVSPAELTRIEQGILPLSDPNLRARMRNLRIADARLRLWRMENGWAPCPKCGDLAPPTFPYNGTQACPRCHVGASYPQRT